jgi:hypothetical protein
MRTISKLVTIASSLMLLFVSGASASGTCSNAMLHGRYAHLIQGVFGPDTSQFGQTFGSGTPFQGIQMLDFDGKGGISGSESLLAGGGEITNNDGKHFTPTVGSYTINPDCTGTAYLCSNHGTGTISGGPSTCNGNTINSPGLLWMNFVAVTVVLAERGKQFHMLVIPPYDTGGVVRTIASTGTRVDDTPTEHREDH